jgi:hypothetical protein
VAWRAAAAALGPAFTLTCLVSPPAAAAQIRNLAFTGDMALAEHRVDDRRVGVGVEISTGTLVGAGVRIGVGSRWTIGAMGWTGVLHPDSGATLPRDVAELGLDGAFRIRDWFDVIGGVRVRSYTTALGRQRWTAPYLGAAGRVPFAVRGLQGLLDLAVHPFASVHGLPRPEFAITSGAAVAYSRGRFDVQLRYSVERYDFARGTADERSEQVSVLTLRVQARARRGLPKTTTAPPGGAAP